VLEVRTGPVVRLAFRNGTDPFATYGLLGHDAGTDVPLADLVAALQPAALNGTAAWCAACGNTADRGCAAYYSTVLRPPQAVSGHRGLSAAGAGAVGAAVTLAVCALGLATLVLLGLLTFGRKSARRSWAPRRSASYAADEPEVRWYRCLCCPAGANWPSPAQEMDMKVRA
jgi:prostatic aicd phosphatase